MFLLELHPNSCKLWAQNTNPVTYVTGVVLISTKLQYSYVLVIEGGVGADLFRHLTKVYTMYILYIMETKVKKWGNSLGVRLPKALLESLSLEDDDTVVLTLDKSTLSLTKKNHKKYTLETLLKGITPQNYNRDYMDSEVGNEKVVW